MATDPEELRKELRQLDQEIAGITAALQDARRDALTVSKTQLSGFEKVTAEMKRQVALANQNGIAIEGSYKDAIADAEQFIKRQKAINKQFKDAPGMINKMQLSIGGLTSELDKFIDYLPGGKTLTRLFGVNELRDNLLDALEEYLNTLGDSLDGTGKLGNKWNAIRKGVVAFVKALNPAKLLMAGFLASAGALFLILKDLSDTANELAKNTGLAFTQAKNLVIQTRMVAVEQETLLATSKDIQSVLGATATEFGTLGMVSAQVAAEVAEIGNAFDYGVEQAAKVNNEFLRMGLTAEDAKNEQLELTLAATKAGVNVGRVTKDIADNAKSTAKFFGGNVKALTKAAVQAAKLGLSIADMAKVADGLLDIESSLANQFELMALTGKEVNFDLARQLALQGDIAGATQSIIDEMGSLPTDMLGLEAAAKASGLTVAQLQDAVALQEFRGKLTDDELIKAQQLGLSAAELNDMTAEELQERMANADAIEKANIGLQAMVDNLKVSVLPLVEMIAGVVARIAEYFKENSGILTGMVATFGTIYGIITAISIVTKGIAAMNAAIATAKLAQRAAAIATMGADKKGLLVSMKALGIMAARATAAAIANPLAAAVGLAMVAGIGAAIYSAMKPAGDMFSPADGKTQISTKEGGLFELSKNDDVIAAPGLSSAMTGGGTTSSGGSMDTSRLEGLMGQLITNISALSNRPVQIVIGGRVVDEIKAQADLNSTYVVGAG